MKKLFTLVTATFLIYSYSFAQHAPLKRTEEYCELRTTAKTFKNKSIAYVDFGDGDKALKDEKGKEIEFGSSVGALNFMNEKGWELVDVHIRIDDGDSYTYYVLKRKLQK